MIPRYSLLFLDLDGTLVGGDDVVSPRTLAALSRAAAIGCTPVICTARNRLVPQIAAQMVGHGYAILSNGAVIAERESGRVIQKIALPPASVQQAARIAHDLQMCPLCFGVHVEEDGGEKIYTDRLFPLPPKYYDRQSYRLIFVDNLENATSLSPVGMGAYGPREQIERLASAWRQALGSEIAVFDAPENRSGGWCAFLNPKAADKALAAQRVAEMLEVPRDRTMAVGDHLNDLELLKWAGLGVCMGDGHEPAKASADYVTGTLADDGAAQAIERFVLGSDASDYDLSAS